MSLTKKSSLSLIAVKLARQLRKESTPAEQILWEVVRDRRLLGRKFLRQHPLFYDIQGKESFFITDFYCHEAKLVIELDGKLHDFMLKEDLNRSTIINLLGITIVRFKNEEIENNLEEVKQKLVNVITHPKSLSY